METCAHNYPYVNSSPRAVAMVLAFVSAIVLSPLYVDRRKSDDSRWSSSGLVLPAVVAGLIVAIKTTTSSSKNALQRRRVDQGGFVLGIGSSTGGLAAILVLLLFVISWQASLQQFFSR